MCFCTDPFCSAATSQAFSCPIETNKVLLNFYLLLLNFYLLWILLNTYSFKTSYKCIFLFLLHTPLTTPVWSHWSPLAAHPRRLGGKQPWAVSAHRRTHPCKHTQLHFFPRSTRQTHTPRLRQSNNWWHTERWGGDEGRGIEGDSGEAQLSLWATLLHNLQVEELHSTGDERHVAFQSIFMMLFSLLCSGGCNYFLNTMSLLLFFNLRAVWGWSSDAKTRIHKCIKERPKCNMFSLPHVLEPPADGAAKGAEGCWGSLTSRGQRLWGLLIAAPTQSINQSINAEMNYFQIELIWCFKEFQLWQWPL